MSNAKIAAFVFAINLFDLGGCDNLVKKGYIGWKLKGSFTWCINWV